ncbi:hypothetical protein BBF96_02065 [Anoxybacter fermentans]|uniref:Uncharacterized protein n=1 Tax=Anoxybacter fermentans TaxID=1323375 RepID=A0A3Q9HNT3_9FIRM|nr:hypothetical protein [Anoxybacter fermentans]AZR72286.1 hypothetical protein BBF96_02065 [Anoxybacter fermentans]
MRDYWSKIFLSLLKRGEVQAVEKGEAHITCSHRGSEKLNIISSATGRSAILALALTYTLQKLCLVFLTVHGHVSKKERFATSSTSPHLKEERFLKR